jgi:hypothetical protein
MWAALGWAKKPGEKYVFKILLLKKTKENK